MSAPKNGVTYPFTTSSSTKFVAQVAAAGQFAMMMMMMMCRSWNEFVRKQRFMLPSDSHQVCFLLRSLLIV